jgi:tetratricopeptide (TPR) repeat protein
MAAVGMSVAAIGTAIACVSATRYSLLGDGAAENLKFIPGTSFGFEAAHLVEPPIPGLKSMDSYAEADPRYYQAPWFQAVIRGPTFADDKQIRLAWLEHLRTEAEAEGLTAEQVAAIGLMRQAESGDAAYALGDAVPPAARLYAAGAVDFDHEEFEAASHRFQAVLDLKPDQARNRAVWAAFMLGRSEARLDDPAAAERAFQLARDLAGRGIPDPLGLAVASYGEEARLYILAALALANAEDFSTDPGTRRRYAEEIVASMQLYADQAAYGSEYGMSSLGFVASSVLKSAERIGAVLDDPFAARVLFAYEDSRAPFENDAPMYDLTDEEKNPPMVETPLVIAIEAHGVAGLPDVDRIAALLYQDGRFDLAFDLADKLDTPLAWWLRAKRSVRQGDLASAAENYRRAIEAFPTAGDDPALTDRRRLRLVAESGSVAMGRGEFLAALGLLAASGYLDEAAYVAERILTIEELKGFLADGTGHPLPIDEGTRGTLRDLLARRLMRAARYDEALPYFLDAETREKARAYGTALRAGAGANTDVERARALFDAAIVARVNGMEILGTSLAPDDAGWYSSAPRWSDKAVPGLLTTQAELDRYRGNASTPDYRFHYRYVAADEAERAAALLPPRSQAFAAILCRATGWMLETEGKEGGEPAGPRARALYARYVEKGAVVPWATHFGYGCPAPDFDAAARLPSMQFDRALHRLLHRRLTYAVIGSAVVLVAGATILFLRRRRIRAA